MAAWNDDDIQLPEFRLKSPLVNPSYFKDRAQFFGSVYTPLVNPIPPMRPDNYWGRASMPFLGENNESDIPLWTSSLPPEKNPGYREFVPFGHIKPWRKAPKLYQD